MKSIRELLRTDRGSRAVAARVTGAPIAQDIAVLIRRLDPKADRRLRYHLATALQIAASTSRSAAR